MTRAALLPRFGQVHEIAMMARGFVMPGATNRQVGLAIIGAEQSGDPSPLRGIVGITAAIRAVRASTDAGFRPLGRLTK
jgi:hypothetical protein